MNQFKNSWEFAFANWKYFLALGLPIIAIESLVGFLVVPLGDITQPEDFMEFFESNGIIIALVSITGLILQISLIGALWVSYMAIDSKQDISPISALQAGLGKFFPIFGAYIVVVIASAFGFLLLILPGIYLIARFSLYAAHIMFEDSKVFESITASWEKTDEHGSRLFMFTLIFALLIFVSILVINSMVPVGYAQSAINAFIEYAMTIPLGYIYFTLYKSLKSN
tara:strand:+ start:1088 stop:1762 length:675 start_codon:yes stop_codon:yes gene_type:complete